MTNEKELSQRFHETIAQHKGILFKVARTYCQNHEDRQDLMQEMMLQIWRSFPKYNGQFKLTTWLYRIVLNTAISYYRNVARRSATLPLDAASNALPDAHEPVKNHHLQLLERFINELNDLDKALMLLYLEEKNHAEIADILGISISNVSTKINRIKERLKGRFSSLNPAE